MSSRYVLIATFDEGQFGPEGYEANIVDRELALFDTKSQAEAYVKASLLKMSTYGTKRYRKASLLYRAEYVEVAIYEPEILPINPTL